MKTPFNVSPDAHAIGVLKDLGRTRQSYGHWLHEIYVTIMLSKLGILLKRMVYTKMGIWKDIKNNDLS
jgi:hypothetical protein